MRNFLSFVFAVVISLVLGVFVEHNFQAIDNIKHCCCLQHNHVKTKKCVCDKCECCNGCPGKCGNCPCDCDNCDCCPACSGHGKKSKVSELKQEMRANPEYTVFTIDRDTLTELIKR